MKSAILIATVFTATALPDAARAQAANRPNVILCMADDQGWEETGYNGHSVVKTPILDEMASALRSGFGEARP